MFPFCGVCVQHLDELLAAQPGFTGYALITADGHVCSPACGPLAEELSVAAESAEGALTDTTEPPSAAATQFLRPFNTLHPTLAFSAFGCQLQVVHQTEGSVFALGPRRRLGLGVCLVPQGVAVVSFDRSLPLPAAVDAAERCAAAIRARCLGA